MGYDLHITRAEENWTNEDMNPITAAEWLKVVASDETLTVNWNDENRLIVTDWTPAECPSKGRQMDWHPGRISMKYPSMSAFLKLLQLSKQLGGRVLGHDGELYETPEDYSPPGI
jgi:hypothetical protein